MPGLKRAQPPAKKSAFDDKSWLVVMRNITTSYDLPKGEFPVILEARRSEVVLELPSGACADGNLLLLRFFEEQEYLKVRNSPRSVQDRAQRLAVTGRASVVLPMAGGKIHVTLELQPSSDKEWQALVKSFAGSEVSAKPAKKKA